MKVQVELAIADEDVGRLTSVLGDPADLGVVLARHAQAALSEYVEMYVGRRAFSRGADILQSRLALLIEHAFDNTLPSEEQVSQMFQTTLPGARSLLAASLAKHRYDLRAAASAQVKVILEAAEWDGEANDFIVQIESQHARVMMNSILAASPGQQQRVALVKGTYLLTPLWGERRHLWRCDDVSDSFEGGFAV